MRPMYINVNFAVKVNDRNKGSFCEVLGDIYSLDELVKVDVDSTAIVNEVTPSEFFAKIKKEGEKNG
jgi:hypothetical protein